MTNEEKILSLLNQLTTDMGDVKQHLAQLDARMDSLDARMDGLDARMDGLDARQTKTEITLENVIIPRLDALAEGQKALMETLAPKSCVEALEEDVSLLKTVARSHSREIAELKKAQ